MHQSKELTCFLGSMENSASALCTDFSLVLLKGNSTFSITKKKLYPLYGLANYSHFKAHGYLPNK